jgi:hypothetical protein
MAAARKGKSNAKKWVWLFLLLISLGGVYWYLHRELQIDSCLDSGGKWDYELGECR